MPRIVLPAVAAVIALATGLSLFGRHAWLLDLLTFGRQQLTVLSVAVAILALYAKQPSTGLIALVCVGVNGAPLLPQNPSTNTATAAAPALPVRILSLNLFASNPRRNPTLESLRGSEADIVLLQESSQRWTRRLGGLADRYPYSFPARGGRPNSNVIISRYPIIEAARLDPPDPREASWNRPIRAVVDIEGRHLAIYVVHPPTPRSLEQWRQRNAELMWLAGRSRELDGGRPRLMAGDFNTPPWSFLFADMAAESGLDDASGGGPRMPTRQPRFLAPYLAWLGAPVDHVLVSPEIAVGGFATGANTYSDHLPVIADLLLPLPDEAQSVKANPAR